MTESGRASNTSGHAPESPPAVRHRHRVLGFLILLFAITYIDRVCISVAGPRMQEDLGIDPIGWGWVTAMFTLSYSLFEIPTGVMGDRLGARRVLTRIVLWWSAFTSLTGMVSNYYLLLVTRFCFGAGEAGAFPNASIVVSRWFAPTQRASISGVLLMASQIGGAIAPLLVVPIQMRYGWRMSFIVFGAVGAVWAAAWYCWFRDTPAEMPGVSEAELKELSAIPPAAGHGFPWRVAFRSDTVLALLVTAFCYIYVYSFFQTWFHTFLVKGRGFSESGLLLSAAPYAIAACANLAGGAASDALVRRFGRTWGRRSLGVAGPRQRVPVHRRRDVHAAAMADHRAAVAGLRRHHVPAGGRLRCVSRPRRAPRRRRCRTDEHLGAGGSVGGVSGLRLHRRLLPQLRCTVRADGGGVVHRHAVLAADRCGGGTEDGAGRRGLRLGA